MTRAANMKKLKDKQKEKSFKLISTLLTGLYSNEYKKPNGKWNITKLAEDTNLHRNTITNHLKMIELI